MHWSNYAENAQRFVVVVIGWAISWAVAADARAEVIFDATFHDSDWSRTAVLRAGPDSFTQLAEQVTDGGNPGAFRKMTHSWGGGTSVAVFHIFENRSYDPGTMGAIASFDYSEDGIVLPGSLTGGLVGRAIALLQDGILYSGGEQAGGFGNTTWQAYTVNGLTATDFRSLAGTDHPDFSAQGKPLYFGYVRTNTITGSLTRTMIHGIDNWQVTIMPVPEPTAMTLWLLAGACGVMCCRFVRRTRGGEQRPEDGGQSASA
jgi:hypothetical protein